MAGVSFTPALQAEYLDLFTQCVVLPGKAAKVDGLVDQLTSNRERYEAVGSGLDIPWFFIGVIHNMESSQSFKGHLHNGDPLTARTVQVPAGRPKMGDPPFTWEESATDALTMHGLDHMKDQSLPRLLYELESYNGWGYRLYHPHVKSPYLWSFSNQYTSGKYVADGTWSDAAGSQQCGAAVLLRRMAERKIIAFDDQPAPKLKDGPLVVGYSMKLSKDGDEVAAAKALQSWLNTHDGIWVKVDGIPGSGTSDAYRLVTGRYLPGDPRA
jgi:lysozyme family protein